MRSGINDPLRRVLPKFVRPRYPELMAELPN